MYDFVNPGSNSQYIKFYEVALHESAHTYASKEEEYKKPGQNFHILRLAIQEPNK